ncbi:MAG: TIGR04255 family protein [Chloroflexi bacterium]|nr:TIGR04255 family protein [Chloroflexota bacterium]
MTIRTFERLKNPPLVEVILELRWRVKSPAGDRQATSAHADASQGPMPVDPSYDLLVGRLSGLLSRAYPFHEKLPSAVIPVDVAPFLVRHRFRKGKDSWPLVQMGPGILTLNDTASYKWSDFYHRAEALLQALFKAHPQKRDIVVDSFLLRYLNAEPFDFLTENVSKFLRQGLKVSFAVPPDLFEQTGVRGVPQGINFQVVYPCESPRGVVQLNVATGTAADQRAVVWETAVVSRGADVPKLPAAAADWLQASYNLTHDWFLKLVEGELLKKYS